MSLIALIVGRPGASSEALAEALAVWAAVGVPALGRLAGAPLGEAWWRLAADAAFSVAGQVAPERVDGPRAGVLPAGGAPAALDQPGWVELRAAGERWSDPDAVAAQQLPGAALWALLLHEDARPTPGLLDALRAEIAEGPALLCLREVFADGQRCVHDWFSVAAQQPLDYTAADPGDAYGDSGALALPLRLIHRALLYVPPAETALGGGVNIALARACRLLGLSVQLSGGTLRLA